MKRTVSRRDQYQWFLPIAIAWGDMDALGHVNNARYLTYSESGRIAFFDELFGRSDMFRTGQGPILAEQTCSYHRQLAYPASCEIAVGIRHIGRTSLTVSTPLFEQGENLAVADTRVTLVWFDYEKQMPIPVPERLRHYHADHPIKEEQE